MPEIIPAILPKDFNDLREHLALARGHAPLVQIDITDGNYVPDKTWPYTEDDGMFQRIANEEEAMPYWQDVDFEIDMMIHHAEQVVNTWLTVGAKRLVVHVDSDTDVWDVIRQVRDVSREPDSVVYTPIGVAMNTTTPLEKAIQYLDTGEDSDSADFVQCMGIERIGYQGQEFDERVLDNVEAIRSRYSDIPINVDGSVNMDTISQLVDAGATRLVAGSAVFESGDVSTEIKNLTSLAQGGGDDAPRHVME